jgi:ribosomal protein S18 acetylase RimI-like enzyme
MLKHLTFQTHYTLMLESTELLRLSNRHIQEASKVFTDAFIDYPLFSYMVENPTARPKIYHHIFQLMIKHTIKFGEAYATSENMEGIALWLPSERSDISIWSNLTNGGIALLRAAGLRIAYRSMVFTEFASKLHHKVINRPHIYLFQIGVKKRHRGKGYASKLMRPMMSQADSEGQPIFLETHDETNIPIYQRYQFETKTHDKIPGSDVNHWTMIRTPQ